MSWWVGLTCPHCGETLTVHDAHEEGGTYRAGGCAEAELNITYNYSAYYYEHLDKESGLKWLNGRKASECVDCLEAAVKALGIQRAPDYWAKTPGNAGYALSILLKWAKEHPEGAFGVN